MKLGQCYNYFSTNPNAIVCYLFQKKECSAKNKEWNPRDWEPGALEEMDN